MIELLGISGGFYFVYVGVPGDISTWKAGKGENIYMDIGVKND